MHLVNIFPVTVLDAAPHKVKVFGFVLLLIIKLSIFASTGEINQLVHLGGRATVQVAPGFSENVLRPLTRGTLFCSGQPLLRNKTQTTAVSPIQARQC